MIAQEDSVPQLFKEPLVLAPATSEVRADAAVLPWLQRSAHGGLRRVPASPDWKHTDVPCPPRYYMQPSDTRECRIWHIALGNGPVACSMANPYPARVSSWGQGLNEIRSSLLVQRAENLPHTAGSCIGRSLSTTMVGHDDPAGYGDSDGKHHQCHDLFLHRHHHPQSVLTAWFRG